MKKELGSLATHRAYLGLPPKVGPITPFPMKPYDVFQNMIAGLGSRLKTLKCKNVVLGLSGGLDSALALLVTYATFDKLRLDKKGIHVYSMPGLATSKRTKGNAELLCKSMEMPLETISIVKSVTQHFKDIGHAENKHDIAYENAQARMRTMILMDKANMVDGIVLGTADLSEIALGWCTYGGDQMSMFGVNAGIPKTVVRNVVTWYAGECTRVQGFKNAKDHKDPRGVQRALDDIVDTPISPELIPGQLTEKKLGSYELHDFFLWNFIVNEMGPKRLCREAQKYFPRRFTPSLVSATCDTFFERFFTQAFKRNTLPDGIRVFPVDLSMRGWWIPSDLGVVRLFG